MSKFIFTKSEKNIDLGLPNIIQSIIFGRLTWIEVKALVEEGLDVKKLREGLDDILVKEKAFTLLPLQQRR